MECGKIDHTNQKPHELGEVYCPCELLKRKNKQTQYAANIRSFITA